jgi:calcineurin-like phosphoesterase family protein
MIYITTDTHLGHKNIIKYCDRPDNFEELIDNGFSILKKDDVLIHLGDFCLGDNEKWHEWLRKFPCKKWLTKGNHDKKTIGYYIENGWDFVSDEFILRYMGETILFSHRPKETNNWTVNIHGHVHNKSDYIPSEKHILLVIEHHYNLFKLEDIINGYRNQPRNSSNN